MSDQPITVAIVPHTHWDREPGADPEARSVFRRRTTDRGPEVVAA